MFLSIFFFYPNGYASPRICRQVLLVGIRYPEKEKHFGLDGKFAPFFQEFGRYTMGKDEK